MHTLHTPEVRRHSGDRQRRVETDKLKIGSLYVSYYEAPPEVGKNADGGTRASIYRNGTMQAVLLLEYEYTQEQFEDPPSSAELEAMDRAVSEHFFDNPDELRIYQVNDSSQPIQNKGWMTSLEPNGRYIHDFSRPTTDHPIAPRWDADDQKVVGVYRVYVIPPTSLTGGEVDLRAIYLPEPDDDPTGEVTISLHQLSITKDDMSLIGYNKYGRAHDFLRIYSLGYGANAVPEGVKLLGLADSGKYGITLAVQGGSGVPKNIHITYMKDNNSKLAGFYDGTFSDDRSSLRLGDTGYSLQGTDWRGSNTVEKTFFCDGAGWERPEEWDTDNHTEAAFAHGIPLVAVFKRYGYKLRENNIKGKRILYNSEGHTFYAYDNCGNKIAFSMLWREQDWDTFNGEPIRLENAWYAGGMGDEP